MKKERRTRPYRMMARAAATARTRREILDSAYRLWREQPLDELTLQDIADGAGVTVQTVLRHFGSKEGVIEAGLREDIGEVQSGRNEAAVGDLESILDVLLPHYESDGPAVLRTLELEGRVEAARLLAEGGRAAHRKWCERVFAPYLPADGPTRTARVDAFVAATDLYVWKLLRLDLGKSLEDTREAIRVLLRGLINLSAEDG